MVAKLKAVSRVKMELSVDSMVYVNAKMATPVSLAVIINEYLRIKIKF